MIEILSREIRKLEIRLERFITEEESFVKELRSCLDKFNKLNNDLEKVSTNPDPKTMEELIHRKLETIEALSETLNKSSDAEHEKSHLLESYGALILSLERAFLDFAYKERTLRENY